MDFVDTVMVDWCLLGGYELMGRDEMVYKSDRAVIRSNKWLGFALNC